MTGSTFTVYLKLLALAERTSGFGRWTCRSLYWHSQCLALLGRGKSGHKATSPEFPWRSGTPAVSDNIHFSKASSASVFIPNFFINQLGGQKPVNELWKQLKPTKRVTQVQYGWWNRASKEVSMTMIPPNANSVRSTDIVVSPVLTILCNSNLNVPKRVYSRRFYFTCIEQVS